MLAEQGLSSAAFSYLGHFGRIGDPQDVVAQAWDLAEVEADYSAFIAEFESARPPTPDDVLVAQLRLVHAWRRFPFVDPQLPEELLPPQWVGTRAAEVFRDRHAAWGSEARRQWDTLAGNVPAAASH